MTKLGKKPTPNKLPKMKSLLSETPAESNEDTNWGDTRWYAELASKGVSNPFVLQSNFSFKRKGNLLKVQRLPDSFCEPMLLYLTVSDRLDTWKDRGNTSKLMLNVCSQDSNASDNDIKNELCMDVFCLLLDPDEVFACAPHTKRLFSQPWIAKQSPV